MRFILVKNEVQYLNEKFDTHEMFYLKASIISTTISQFLLGVQNNKTIYEPSFFNFEDHISTF